MIPGYEPTADQRRELADLLRGWLAQQRWFAGKGHDITAVTVCEAFTLPGQVAALDLVVGAELDGDHWQTYQVPVSVYADPHPDLAAIGQLPGGLWVYDALRDPAAAASMLADRTDEPTVDPSLTHGAADQAGAHPGPQLQAVADPATYAGQPSRPLGVEQSNTSLVFGDAAMVKFFRQLTPGTNPDVEVHAALGVARCPSVGRSLGWVNAGWRDPATGHWVAGHTAMVQQLLAPAVEGWELALSRLGAGAPFAAEARELGAATAQVHRDLREVLGARVLAEHEVGDLVDRLHWRLDQAAAAVEQLAPLAAPLHERIEAVRGLGEPFTVQRVHGDLHLQQVMRAADGWKLLDFEGEPGSAIADRIAPDHPLRDVAGMLRSFAYAAAQGGRREDPATAQWLSQCQDAFLAGYQQVAPASPGQAGAEAAEATLAAYLIDKAAYEAAYERRNRPDWLPIPLDALAALAR